MDENYGAKQHFAEEAGLFFEQSGVPRMAGRIIGWLLICDPPDQDAPELAEALQASAGSISSATQYLTQLGLIERRSLPGKRRIHYRIRAGMWPDLVLAKWRTLRTFREIAERGLELLDDDSSEARDRLLEVRDLYAFFEQELPALMDRWQRENEK